MTGVRVCWPRPTGGGASPMHSAVGVSVLWCGSILQVLDSTCSFSAQAGHHTLKPPRLQFRRASRCWSSSLSSPPPDPRVGHSASDSDRGRRQPNGAWPSSFTQHEPAMPSDGPSQPSASALASGASGSQPGPVGSPGSSHLGQSLSLPLPLAVHANRGLCCVVLCFVALRWVLQHCLRF